MILLVKRKQILYEGGALQLRGNEVFRKLVDKGHIFKSVALEPPQDSVLLSWEEISNEVHTGGVRTMLDTGV